MCPLLKMHHKLGTPSYREIPISIGKLFIAIWENGRILSPKLYKLGKTDQHTHTYKKCAKNRTWAHVQFEVKTFELVVVFHVL